MESTSIMTGEVAPGAVAVAVKGGGNGSRRAVRWAMENLFQKADRFVLIHVIPIITSVPTPSGDEIPIEDLEASLVNMYVQDLKSQIQQVFIPFQTLCKGKKIETLVIEGDKPASGLVGYASSSGINTLVLGSSSSTWLMRNLYKTGVPSAVIKHALTTCNVYVVSKHGLISGSDNNSRLRCGSIKLFCGLCSSSMEDKVQSTYAPSAAPDVNRLSLNSRASTHNDSSAGGRSGPRRSLGDAILQTRALSGSSVSSSCADQSNLNAEVEQLRLELQNAVNMYNRACDDLVYTQNKVRMLSSNRLEDAKRIDSSAERERKFRKIAAEEKEKHLEAVKEVETARNLLAKEAYGREMAETKALNESMEKQELVDELFTNDKRYDKRYKRYTIGEIEVATGYFSKNKVVGEGAYGKVYKCDLDRTPVAIKVLLSDTSEKKREFLREVDVLSQLSHPHMVQLIGACPERGCLIYEYMENGSLEDYISQQTRKSSLSWSTRFRIVFEVACALAFLHNSKPEPIVHRDLKPGNILLDGNFVSKIGDVGMAKLMMEVVPDNVTEYKESIIAGTMFYVDPEYHRTGIVRPKSDLYAFGIIILQLLTMLPPKGITDRVESAVSSGCLVDILDESVPDWPLAEVKEMAQVGLECCSLRCRDRPDLDSEVLPVLKKLSEFGDTRRKVEENNIDAPSYFYCPILQEVMNDPHIASDGFTYENKAIQMWLERQNVSPVTKHQLQHKTLTPNHTLRSAIQDWRSHSTSSKSQV